MLSTHLVQSFRGPQASVAVVNHHAQCNRATWQNMPIHVHRGLGICSAASRPMMKKPSFASDHIHDCYRGAASRLKLCQLFPAQYLLSGFFVSEQLSKAQSPSQVP